MARRSFGKLPPSFITTAASVFGETLGERVFVERRGQDGQHVVAPCHRLSRRRETPDMPETPAQISTRKRPSSRVKICMKEP